MTGAGAGKTSLLEIASPVTLNGGVLQANTSGFSFAAGQTFTVMDLDPGSLNGLFDSLQYGARTGNGTGVDLGNGLTLGALYNDHAGNIQLKVVNTPASTAVNWNGGTGTWNTGSGWDTGLAPTFYSDVGIGLTTSGLVTLNQDATIDSLVVHNGNTLQYQAATPATLTVGDEVTVEIGGALTLGTSGDKLALGGDFANAGTTTLASGALLSGQGAAANQGDGLIELQGGALTAASLTNNGTIRGFGSLTPAVGNNALVQASGGTLVAVSGIAGAGGTVLVDAAATLTLGADSSAGALTNNGTLALGASNVSVSADYANAGFGSGNAFDARANVTGAGQILATGDVAIGISGAGISGGATAAPTLALGNVHVGATSNRSFGIDNTGMIGPSIRGALQDTGITSSDLGIAAQNFGPIAAGGPETIDYTYTASASGALSGQSFDLVANFDNVEGKTVTVTGTAYNLAAGSASPSPISIANQRVGGTNGQVLTVSNTALDDGFSEALNASGNVYRLAEASIDNPLDFHFGNVHVGDAITQAISISNTAVADSFSESLNASFGAISDARIATNGGAVNRLAAGGTDASSMVVNLDTGAAGNLNGTVTLNFASDGTGTSGLGITGLPSQDLAVTASISATAYRLANPVVNTTQPIAFGNFREGDAVTAQALSIANAVPNDGLSEALNAAANGTTGGVLTNGGSFDLLAPEGTNDTAIEVSIDTATAGDKSGVATIDFASDGTGSSGLGITPLASQDVQVTGAVYRLAAAAVAPNPVVIAARVGDAVGQVLAIANTAAADGFSESLAVVAAGASGDAILSGVASGPIAAGASNGDLTVAVDTGVSGIKLGTVELAFASDGTGTSGLAPIAISGAAVAVQGKVYAPAVADVQTTSVDFGVVRQGDLVAERTIAVGNAATGALTDVLTGGFSAVAAPFRGTGDLGGGVTAGDTDNASLAVGLDTGSAGFFGGDADLALSSHNEEMTDLSLGTFQIGLDAQVNALANPAFDKMAGTGNLAGGGTLFNLDLGTLVAGSAVGMLEAELALLNEGLLLSAQDDLSGSFFGEENAGGSFDFVGFNAFANLAVGMALDNLLVSFDPTGLAPGTFSGMIFLAPVSTYTGLADLDLDPVRLLVTARIVAPGVPEPAIVLLLLPASASLLWVRRRRRV